MKLLGADTARDGGSLAAFFRKDARELLGLWLQVAPWCEPGAERQYLQLRVSSDVRPEHGRCLVAGSVEETDLLADLDEWLATPAYSSEWSNTSNVRALEFVQELRVQAGKRMA